MAGLNWSTASDWDAGSHVSGNGYIVHDNNGDRSADQLQQGYPAKDETGNSSLVFYATMDESSAPIANLGSVGDSGTEHGNPDYELSGINDTTHISFDGNGDYFEFSDHDSYSLIESGDAGFTLFCWALAGETDKNKAIINKENEFIVGRNGQSGLYIESGSTTTEKVPNSQYMGDFSGAVVYDKANDIAKFYWNGNKQAETTNFTISSSNTTNPFYIGSGAGGSTSLDYELTLDEIRVYDQPLSSSQISDLYNTAAGTSKYRTGTKTSSSDMNINKLALESNAALNELTAKITVLSDPDADGTFEETSDTITLDGSGGPYSVTGLTSNSSNFKLEVELTSTDFYSSRTVKISSLELVQSASITTTESNLVSNSTSTSLGTVSPSIKITSSQARSNDMLIAETVDIDITNLNSLSNSLNTKQVVEVIESKLNSASLSTSTSLGIASAKLIESLTKNSAESLQIAEIAQLVTGKAIEIGAGTLTPVFTADITTTNVDMVPRDLASKMVAEFLLSSVNSRAIRVNQQGAQPARLANLKVQPNKNSISIKSSEKNQVSTRVKSDRLLDTE